MIIENGVCSGFANNKPFSVTKNQIALIDCYTPHEYGSPSNWEATWLHFDGPLARTYFELITKKLGFVLSLKNTHDIRHSLNNIINSFKKSKSISESSLSNQITNLLDALLDGQKIPQHGSLNYKVIEETKSYINNHFNQPINIDFLASKASLSQFHFIRVFSNETGFTPHKYLVATRINVAKFLLKSSETSIKDIAFSCGFNSESSFCSTFKKWEQLTPSQYRNHSLQK